MKYDIVMPRHYNIILQYHYNITGMRLCQVYIQRFVIAGLHTTISYRRKKDFIASDFDNDFVEEIPLSLYEIFDDPNDLLDCWYSHFMKILDRHAPLIKRRVRNNKLPGWFNSEVRCFSRKRDFFLKQFLKIKNSDTWCTYKKWRNRTVHIIKKSKEDYYKNLLTDNVHNPRQLWKILKDMHLADQ